MNERERQRGGAWLVAIANIKVSLTAIIRTVDDQNLDCEQTMEQVKEAAQDAIKLIDEMLDKVLDDAS
jgi:hypothetical protein